MAYRVADTKTEAIYEGGCDYITCVQMGRDTESSLVALGAELVNEQFEAGEERRPFRFSGYAGMICGSASYGRRYDSQIVRLSSHVAREHWKQAFQLSTNVTRFDVQVTVLPTVGPTRRLLDHHKQLRRKARGVGRPAKFKFWYGPTGPEAATLGSRTSDWFGRVYDKGLESKLPEYHGTVRYEVEVKRGVALAHARRLASAESELTESARIVRTFLDRRHIRLPAWTGNEAYLEIFADRETVAPRGTSNPLISEDISGTNAEVSIGQGRMRRRASWLANAVRPTIQLFLDRGKERELLEALGLSVENGTIVNDKSETWSTYNRWR